MPGRTYALYTTASCPQCRMIKPVLEKAGIPFTQRDAEQYKKEAMALGLRQVPSLVVSMENGDTVIYAGYAQIKAYIEGRNAAV